jgi:predicted transcriptional regulator
MTISRFGEMNMKVKDIMHKGMTFVEPSASLKDVARRMRDDDIGAIPVRANGQLVGMVTDRDIACRAVADKENLSNLTARDIMTKGVACCGPDDDIALAIKTMETKRIRRLAVANAEGDFVGMLSLGDVSHNVPQELSGEVLRAVSAHNR